MEWIKFSPLNLPPQGMKILCFNLGDAWVARRINYRGKDYWVEIGYGGENFSILTDCPSYWLKPDYPEGCTGCMRVGLREDELMTMDEFQEKHPLKHEELVRAIIKNSFDRVKKPKTKKKK